MISFFAPDARTVVGGVRQIYRFVDVCNAAGIPAQVVHGVPGHRCTWFPNETAVAFAGDVDVGPRDLLVFPEVYAGHVPRVAPGVSKVILSQNAYCTFLHFDDKGRTVPASADAVAGAYRHRDVSGVVTVSEENKAFVEYVLPGVPVERIHCGIDTDQLRPPAGDKDRAICFMPRKRIQEAADVLGILRLRGALDGWDIRPIHEVDADTAAAIINASAVFLGFSHREGFGLPVAEGLAAGCEVIGFSGFGGIELFGEHAVEVPEGDVLAFARTVESVLASWDTDAEARARRAERSRQFVVEHYSREREAADVLEVFGRLADGASSSGGSTTFRLAPLVRPYRRWRVAAVRAKSAVTVLFERR